MGNVMREYEARLVRLCYPYDGRFSVDVPAPRDYDLLREELFEDVGFLVALNGIARVIGLARVEGKEFYAGVLIDAGRFLEDACRLNSKGFFTSPFYQPKTTLFPLLTRISSLARFEDLVNSHPERLVTG